MNDETNKSKDENTPEPVAEESRAGSGDTANIEDAQIIEGESEAVPPSEPESKTEPEPEPVSEPEEPPKPAKKKAAEKPKSKKGGRFVWVLLILVIGLFGIAGGLGYFTYTGWQKAQQISIAQQASLQQLEQSLSQVQAKNQSLQSSLNSEKQAAQKQQSALASRLQVAEKRIIAQNKRLQSMSSTSRDDWLLAEAEYLLKLANQRVLIEREAESAVGLLDEADAILRDMVDPDLFPLRKAIAQDLAALRLSKSIDVEGLYLSLLALAQQIDALPTRPEPKLGADVAEDDTVDTSALLEANVDHWWSVPFASFKRFVDTFLNQIKVTPHEESGRPVVLMQPQTHLYLKQNLRMQLERAQLALLREQQKIYSESLSQAAFWVREYFPKSEQTQTFIGELQKLETEMVVKQLPDISGSWELLNTYIQELHDLEYLQGEKPAVSEVKEAAQGKQGGEQ